MIANNMRRNLWYFVNVDIISYILMNIQIENEYGSFFTCDKNYTGQLRDQVKSVLGDDVVIYTTDGAGDNYLKCGKVEGTYATVDFGGGQLYFW